MKQPIDLKILKECKSTIQPIPIPELCERYSVDIRTGMIYDYEEFMQISPELIDGVLVVELESDSYKKYNFSICDILSKMIYGYTNSTKFRPNLTDFPCDFSIMTPRIHKLIELDDNRIEINDIVYRRWLDSEYYVSEYGAIFSIPYGAFLRQNFNEKGYKSIRTKENGVGKTYKVHRLVWESINGKIPDGKEIDHINNRRWDNVISNLQVLTHLENLQKKNPDVYRTYSDETIINIGKDLIAGIPTKDIAKKYAISRARVWEIKFHDLYSDILSAAGVDLSNVDRDHKTLVTKKSVPDILEMRKRGIPVKEIANKYNVSFGFIYDILKYKGFPPEWRYKTCKEEGSTTIESIA